MATTVRTTEPHSQPHEHALDPVAAKPGEQQPVEPPRVNARPEPKQRVRIVAGLSCLVCV